MKLMFSIPFAICFLLLSSCSHQTKIDCDKFKNGTFFYRGDTDNKLYKIERNDSIQKETLVKTGDYAILKINWTGPCEYELTFLSQHIIATDPVISSDQKMKLKTKIIRIKNDSCFTSSQIKGNDYNSMKGVLYIDKNYDKN